MLYISIIKRGKTPIRKGLLVMWSFEIYERNGDGSAIIFGYNWQDAFRRAKLNPDEWDIVSSFYED